jgi:hypothetical protein
VQVQRAIRRRLPGQLCDASGEPPCGVALYSLSDPRALREIRYVGQSASPRRRLLEHLRTARCCSSALRSQLQGGTSRAV